MFASKLPPPLRPPYVRELHTPPSPLTAFRSLALEPFEEQLHQLFGKENMLHGGKTYWNVTLGLLYMYDSNCCTAYYYICHTDILFIILQ